MQMSPGCNCCCLALEVDNDQESKWESDSYASGVNDSITILEPVDLCNFRLELFGDMPTFVSPGYPDFTGTIDIYFLEAADDDNVDAVGSITLTSIDAIAEGPSYTRTEDPPFWVDEGQTDAVAVRTVGTGNVDITDAGITDQDFDHWGLGLSGSSPIVIQSVDNVIEFGPFNGHIASGTDPSDVETMGKVVINRNSCTSQQVYIRYELSDDFDLDTTGTKFNLYDLNEIGDESCRTETAYYDAEPEDGSCTSPDLICGHWPTRQAPFIRVRYVLPNIDSGAYDYDVTLWSFTRSSSGPSGSCGLGHQGWGEGGFSPLISMDGYVECDGGDSLMHLEFLFLYGGAYYSTWDIELPQFIEHPNEIPTTVLNEANSTTFNYPYSNLELTVN